MENLIGKEILAIEDSKKLDEGFVITFTDGFTLEVCWNEQEGYKEIKSNTTL